MKEARARHAGLARIVASRGNLATSLRELEEEGLIQRRVVTAKPIQAYYSLSEKGKGGLSTAITGPGAWPNRPLDFQGHRGGLLDGPIAPEVPTVFRSRVLKVSSSSLFCRNSTSKVLTRPFGALCLARRSQSVLMPQR